MCTCSVRVCCAVFKHFGAVQFQLAFETFFFNAFFLAEFLSSQQPTICWLLVCPVLHCADAFASLSLYNMPSSCDTRKQIRLGKRQNLQKGLNQSIHWNLETFPSLLQFRFIAHIYCTMIRFTPPLLQCKRLLVF